MKALGLKRGINMKTIQINRVAQMSNERQDNELRVTACPRGDDSSVFNETAYLIAAKALHKISMGSRH